MLGYLGAIVCRQFGLTRCCLRRKAIFIHMVWKHVPINSQRQNISLGASVYFYFERRVRMINIRQFYSELCKSFIFYWSNIGTVNLNCLKTQLIRVWICLFNCVYLVLTCLGLWYPTPRLLPKWRLGFLVLCLFISAHLFPVVPLVKLSAPSTLSWALFFMADTTFSTSEVEFCLIASMLVSWERADADAPRCSRDFMSMTASSLVLAMSIALPSFNLSSFPKRTSCIFRSRVPIISCSIIRSSSLASLNRHFWVCILHLAVNGSTLSSSACLWNLAVGTLQSKNLT